MAWVPCALLDGKEMGAPSAETSCCGSISASAQAGGRLRASREFSIAP